MNVLNVCVNNSFYQRSMEEGSHCNANIFTSAKEVLFS